MLSRWSCTYPPVGVTSGRNHNDLVFEKSKVLRTDYSTVHQSFDQFVMGPAARNLQHTQVKF